MARRRKAVAVSKLADYAADPAGFIARRGGTRSKKAAALGTRYHDRLGRHSAAAFWVSLLLLVVVAALLARHWGIL